MSEVVIEHMLSRPREGRRPIIGITTDIDVADNRRFVRPAYALAVERCGGIPVVLSPAVELAAAYVEVCDGFVFTGGDDPIMEHWSIATHPKATPVHADRQAFELALLHELDQQPDKPVLGICLGMQYIALHAGGKIDQHLPESHPELARNHWDKASHKVEFCWQDEKIIGDVLSHHRQVITDAGALAVVGQSLGDGVIEAVADPNRAFYLGVQWHPEKTRQHFLGDQILEMLVAASGKVAVVTE